MPVRLLLCLCVLVFAGTAAAASEADNRLAIKGYDPVAYFTESRPMRGDPKYQHEWDGAVYHFASVKHLELFKADPERYAPQYGNLCTAALSRGEIAISDPENWIIQNGRLHLFAKSIGPGKMQAHPDGMKRAADKHWATLPAGAATRRE